MILSEKFVIVKLISLYRVRSYLQKVSLHYSHRLILLFVAVKRLAVEFESFIKLDYVFFLSIIRNSNLKISKKDPPKTETDSYIAYRNCIKYSGHFMISIGDSPFP